MSDLLAILISFSTQMLLLGNMESLNMYLYLEDLFFLKSFILYLKYIHVMVYISNAKSY